MKKKVYWKEILSSFTSSWGRTISIVLLLALGSMTLSGLKVVSPNMERTAQKFINETNMANLSVMSNYGISKKDTQLLKSIKNSKVEFGYMDDVTIKGTDNAIRVSSRNNFITKNQILNGKFPQKSNQIAISDSLSNKYKIGDKIIFEYGNESTLKHKKYEVVGFVNSPDIWSKNIMGKSSAGDGELYGYAIVTKEAFNSKTYTIARLTYDNLDNVIYNSKSYKNLENKNRDQLTNLLKKRKENDIKSSSIKNSDELEKSKQVAAKEYKIYTRSSLPGGEGYIAFDRSTVGISSIGNLFPIVLYLVAALVTLTTMTRFVDEERNNTGILRALGYTKFQIIGKFVFFGLTTSMLGTIIGFIIGNYGISPIIERIVSKGMVIGDSQLHFYPYYLLISILLGIIATVLPSYLVSRSELNEEPSQLLLPKPPVAGSKILLEKIKFIWSRMSFTRKVTARNIFRYKKRMLMTIFGVAGSVALFFTGLGIQSSIHGVTDTQFKDIVKYNAIVVENPLASDSQKTELLRYIKKGAKDQKKFELISQDLKTPGIEEKQSVNIFVFPSNEIQKYIDLRTRKNKNKIKLNGKGVVLSEKLANLYRVKKGDTFSLKLNGSLVDTKVSGISEMYAGHYIFMDKHYYEKISKHKYHSNARLLKLKSVSDAGIRHSASMLLKMDAVALVSQNTTLRQMIRNFSKSMQSVTLILIILSMLLAVVILFNLININLSERVRELSTIKVLGFHNKEATMYIYRETIILSMIGVIIGWILGGYLHSKIIKMIVADEIMFNPSVNSYVYIVPLLVVGIILWFLGYMVSRSLSKIDMLGALKSVD